MDLQEAQKRDTALQKLIAFKSAHRPRPEFSEWAGDSVLRRLWYQYDRIFLRDDILFRSLSKDSPIPRYAVVVPESLVPVILKGVHDSPFSSHLGVTKTLDRIRDRFYWSGMGESVELYIHECPVYAQGKDSPNLNKAPLRSIEVGEPFSFWAMDFMGPFPETAQGNRHILVVMDHFTKWCEAIPTQDQKARTVAPILVNRIFSRFGPPTVLHSDQGANFESNLMHHICHVMGITKTRTTGYHPSGDGQVERQNRTLQGMLSAFVSQHTVDWDLWPDPVTYAYNSSRQESTGVSPYEVVFGRLPRMPLELELGLSLSNSATVSKYVQSVRGALRDIRQIAKDNLKQARAKQRQHWENKQSGWSWKPFRSGQFVWLRRPKTWKLGKKWTGPFLVVAGMVNYRIQSPSGRILVVHHDHLKLHYAPTEPRNVFCPVREHGDFTFVDHGPLPPVIRDLKIRGRDALGRR